MGKIIHFTKRIEFGAFKAGVRVKTASVKLNGFIRFRNMLNMFQIYSKRKTLYFIIVFRQRFYSVYISIHAFFYIRNTFISNARLKLAKIQSNAKQHPEAERLPFESYSHSSSTLSSKNNRTCSKK